MEDLRYPLTVINFCAKFWLFVYDFGWFCLVVYGLTGFGWLCMVLPGCDWFCMAVDDFGWLCMVLAGCVYYN